MTGELPGDAITAWEAWYDEAGDDLGTAPTYISRESFRAGWEAAVPVTAAQEREACARLAEQHNAIYYTKSDGYRPVADLIRARRRQPKPMRPTRNG